MLHVCLNVRAEGCAMFLSDADIGCTKEDPPAVSLSVVLPCAPPPPNDTAPTPFPPDLATSNRKDKVLLPKQTQRSIERETAAHTNNGLFVSFARTF